MDPPKDPPLLQASGDSLWKLIEKEGVFCMEDIKLIMKVNGMDSLYFLSKFNDSNKETIVDFMRKQLHRLIKKEEWEQYYGFLYKDCPERFEFNAGQLQVLKDLSATAKRILQENMKRPASFEASNESSPSPSKGKKKKLDTNTSLIEQKKVLEKQVDVYIAANFKAIKDRNINCIVATDGMGGIFAKCQCPYPECEERRRVTRIETRWNTSNFYSHIWTHFERNRRNKHKRNKTQKGNRRIDEMFTSGTNDNNLQDSDDDNFNGQKVSTARRTSRKINTIESDDETIDDPPAGSPNDANGSVF